MKVKKSKFTRMINIEPNEWMVHNLSSGSECILNNLEVQTLLDCINHEYSKLPELLSQLLEMGIVVPFETDENACLELERKISLYSFSENEVGFVIAPTMDCNAQCFYCYENDTRQKCYMNSETQGEMINYIQKTAEGKKKLFISWFGGEPLLCMSLIKSVTLALLAFCEQNNIEYNSELTTNGYYLDSFIENLQACRITDTQITLDGYGKEYLKRKQYVDCEDAWEKVTNNIFSASVAGNHITIRFNVDRNNVESVKKCVNFLISNPRWNENIAIYFYPLEPDYQHSNNTVYFKESEYEVVMTDLYDYLYQCGYYDDRDYALDFHKLSLPCYGATLGILAIDYRGYLYQCQHLLCREKFAIGNVFTGVPITKPLLHWYDGKISTSCEECEVLPLCQGGCVTKPRIGKNEYICHMMKYRLKIQETMKVRHYLRNQKALSESMKGGESNESD